MVANKFHSPDLVYINRGLYAPLGSPITFLLRDDFITPEADPLTSPRTAQPGPGSWTIFADNGATFDIASGKLEIRGDNAAYTNAVLTSVDEIARSSGVGLFWNILDGNSTGDASFDGFQSAENFNYANQYVKDGHAGAHGIGTDIINNDWYGIIMRSDGAFYVVYDGTNWKLLHIDDAKTADVKIEFQRFSTVLAQYEVILVAQLTSPWNSDYGITIDNLPGNRNPGDTFTHDADGTIFCNVPARPTAGQIELRFRMQDASNYWQVTVNSAGDLDLDEVVAGVPTQRGTAAGVMAASDDLIQILMRDERIIVSDLSASRINYSSAANFKTETSGDLNSEGTGGSVANISTYPYILSGQAKASLDVML